MFFPNQALISGVEDMQINKGASRIVFVTPKFVIKFPRLISWKHFLTGLLANLQEKRFAVSDWQELCPVLLSCPFGFWLIMPYAQPLSDSDWLEFNYKKFVDRVNYCVPVENKRDSFGVLNDRIVAIDYGN